MKTYRMCGLLQNNVHTVGWIEDRGTKVGASVEIPELGGFWEVISVGTVTKTAKEMADKQRMDRNSFKSIK